jgi:thiol:disulfide interchange protein DsbD
MEKGTLSDPEVASALKRFVLLKPDVTDAYSAESKAMKQRFGVLGPPATLFFSANGEERRDLHFYGYLPPAEFLQKINQT